MNDLTKLTTKFGPVVIKPTSATHIFVGVDRGTDNLVVHGVPYHVSLHFERNGSQWALQRDGVYIRRSDRWTNDWPSASARTKLTDEITAVVNAWAGKNAEALLDAERDALDAAIESIESKIKEKDDELTALRGEWFKLKSKRGDLTPPLAQPLSRNSSTTRARS